MIFPTKEHIEAAQEAAEYWKAKTGVYVWPSVTLAQALIESAGWTKLAGVNNGFGITEPNKARQVPGVSSFVWTEEVINGQRVKMKRWFANFDTLRDAYIAHGRILATVKAYKAAWAAKTASGFVEGIGAYATAPNYRASILATMARLKLEQYDNPLLAAVPAHDPKPAANGAKIGTVAGAAGAVVVAVAPHLHMPNLAMITGFAVVAAVVGVGAYLAHRKASVPASATPPAPEVLALLDELAPLPGAA